MTTELQHLETTLELEHYLLMTGYSTPENHAGATAAIRSRIAALENSGESLEDT